MAKNKDVETIEIPAHSPETIEIPAIALRAEEVFLEAVQVSDNDLVILNSN